MGERVLHVDGMNLFIRNFVVIPVTNDDGEHFGGTFGFLRSLRAMVQTFKPTVVAISWEGTSAGLRRKNLLKEYKANRGKRIWTRGSVKAFDFITEKEKKDNFKMQIQRLDEYLDVFPFKVFKLPFVEADDIIAEYVNKAPSDDHVIYSMDADYHQLIGSNTVCYNGVSRQLWSHDSFVKKHGFLPHNYIFIKCILGDKSDNIPGMYGYGEKTAIKLFPTLATETVNDITDFEELVKHEYHNNAHTKSQTTKIKEVIDNWDMIMLNYQLMQLHDVNISFQDKQSVKELFIDGDVNKFDRVQLRKLFLEDKLASQVKHFESWVTPFSHLQR